MTREEFINLCIKDGLSPEFATRQWNNPEVRESLNRTDNPVKLVKAVNQIFVSLFGAA